MGAFKKAVAVASMLVFLLSGLTAGGYLFVLSAGPTFSVTSAIDYVLAAVLFCLLMLSMFAGMCLGVLAWMLALKPFASKEEVRETFIADRDYSYPRTTRLLETLLDVIY